MSDPSDRVIARSRKTNGVVHPKEATVHTRDGSCHSLRVPDYTLGDVARILKVSPRRLRYWQQTRLVQRDRGETNAAPAFAAAHACSGVKMSVQLMGMPAWLSVRIDLSPS